MSDDAYERERDRLIEEEDPCVVVDELLELRKKVTDFEYGIRYHHPTDGWRIANRYHQGVYEPGYWGEKAEREKVLAELLTDYPLHVFLLVKRYKAGPIHNA